MKVLLRLYPPAWRTRYEAEVSDLLGEVPSSPHAAVDLIRGAFREWVHLAARPALTLAQSVGGPAMLASPLQRHPTSLALLALLLVAPTFVGVLVSMLAYQIWVPGLAAAVEPVKDTLTAWRWVDRFLLYAPLLAFVVAVVPLVGLGLGRSKGELRLTITLRARALNLVVLTLSVLLAGLLFGDLERGFLWEVAV